MTVSAPCVLFVAFRSDEIGSSPAFSKWRAARKVDAIIPDAVTAIKVDRSSTT